MCTKPWALLLALIPCFSICPAQANPVNGKIIIDDFAKKRPKYGGPEKEGTLVRFSLGSLPQGTTYLILVPEIRGSESNEWREVGCRGQAAFRQHYSYKYPSGNVIARDIIKKPFASQIELFVPDEVLSVTADAGDIRYKIELLSQSGDTISVGRLPEVPFSTSGNSGGSYRIYRGVVPERKSVGVDINFTNP